MDNVILVTNHVVQNMSCDEVTPIDNHSWISMHYYVVENWQRIPTPLNLQKVIEGGGFNNLTTILVNFVAAFGGLGIQVS